MIDVILLVFPLFAMIFLGFVSGKIGGIEIDGLKWMNFFIIYIALPPMFFQLLAKTPIEQFANIVFALVAALATLIIFLVIIVLGVFWRRASLAAATIQGFAAAYGNIGYMGVPLAIAAFGPMAGAPAALFFAVENSMHFMLAPLLMAFHDRAGLSILRLGAMILWRIFTHPFILATIAGIAVAFLRIELPEVIDKVLDLLAGAAGPCALFVIGVTAALRPLGRVPTELPYIIFAKLIIHPILCYLLLNWLTPDIDRLWLEVAILMATLPAATNVFVLAQQYHVWQERASSAVVVSTAISIATITIWLYLLRVGWL